MTVGELVTKTGFAVAHGGDMSREIEKVYCCDMLSIAMGRAPADGAWVTVMGNMNAVAVGVLADVSCIVLAEGVAPDETCLQKAREQEVNLLTCEDAVFETALKIYELLK